MSKGDKVLGKIFGLFKPTQKRPGVLLKEDFKEDPMDIEDDCEWLMYEFLRTDGKGKKRKVNPIEGK